MAVVIHHNPTCGTSRYVLALLIDAGLDPIVIEYLNSGWTKSQLQGLFAAANISPREAMRDKRSPAEELGLLKPSMSDEEILNAMVAHPELVERPIVCTAKGVRLCRPAETVLDLLDSYPPGPYAGKNGQLIINDHGERIS